MDGVAVLTQRFDYDVFLSFRGSDTRTNFTDVLYNSMVDAGIRVFRNDDELSAGQKIEEILSAIKNSEICMPVFSKSFASSAWCLREVATMVELNKDIVPIFLDVTVDDVKVQTPVYRDDMRKHEETRGKDLVKQWEDALRKVTKVKGRELRNKGYYQFINELVKEMLIRFKPNHKHVPSHLVGMDAHLGRAIEKIESRVIPVLGIHGMGGSGNSTLAMVLFNRLSSTFEKHSFLENVRETVDRHGIEHLQRNLLRNLNPKLGDTSHIANPINMIQKSFQRKKVLIVLDDVDKKEHIENLVRDPNWFGPGSVIIITTRDLRVLEESFHPEVLSIVEMELLKTPEALQLFSWHAFGGNAPIDGYESLSDEVVSTCGGLPLALQVIGSLLHRKDKNIWTETKKKLERVPRHEVQEKLRISYDTLEDAEKQMFLDIACFFVNTEKTNPVYMWDACGFSPNLGLLALESLSLVKVVDDHKIWMHDLLRSLGIDIIQKEGCSRYYERGDRILNVLKSMADKEKIVGLRMDGPCDGARGEELNGMWNLRFLSLEDAKFGGRKFNSALPRLKWLSWRHLPSSLKTANLNIEKLVILELSHSPVNNKWSGWKQIQMVHLKVLDLTSCKKLSTTPDFSRMPSLEKLTLRKCDNLAKLHRSIVLLKELKYLDLSFCSSLCELPEDIGFLQSLEQISLHGCTKLEALPSSLGKLKSLIAMDLSRKVHPQIWTLVIVMGAAQVSASWLDYLDPSHLLDFLDQSFMQQVIDIAKLAKDIFLPPRFVETKLPNNFGDLRALTKLDLSSSQVLHLPESLGNLENLRDLNARCSHLTTLPKSIGMLKKLETLDLGLCMRMEQVPVEIGGLSSLRMLNLSGTSIQHLPSTVSRLHLLQSLNLWGCGFLADFIEPAEQAHGALPGTFADCSHLEVLELSCGRLSSIPPLPSSIRRLSLDRFNHKVKLPDSLDLNNMTHLCICCDLGSRCDSLTLFPQSLREMRIIYSSSLPDLSHLKNLQKFVLVGGDSLQEIPGLGKLESLQELVVSHCRFVDTLEDLSELKELRYISIRQCTFPRGLAGLDGLSRVEKDVHLPHCTCAECSLGNSERSAKRALLSWLTTVGFSPSDLPRNVQHFLETLDSSSSSFSKALFKFFIPG